MKVLFAVVLLGTIIYDVLGARMCKPNPVTCLNEECDREQVCEYGICQEDGSCLCNPCYKGDSCTEYVDENYPYFLKKEEVIYIDVSHQGLVFQAKAFDDDTYKTCLPESTFPCPCSHVYYELIGEIGNDKSEYFDIDGNTGAITLKENVLLRAGETFHVDVAVSNYREEDKFDTKILSIDIQKLTINVQQSHTLEDFLRESEIQDFNYEKDKYSEKLNSKYAQNEISELGNEDEHSNRIKREAFGDKPADSNLTLRIVNGGSEPMKPGESVDFEMTIILPNIPAGSEMDMLAEIYVMDTITGITTLALCNVVVTDIGGGGTMIKKKGGAPLTIADVVIDKEANDIYPFYDRALVRFGLIYNEDPYTASGANYGPSTIIITFTAVMISNPSYLNSSAIVTAGAEYNSEEYVWVSQAEFTYDNTLVGYPADVTIRGPDEIKAGGAAQFDIDAFISHPFEQKLEIEIFTPNDIYDTFSVTSLQVVQRGANHVCVINNEKLVFQKSVSGKTNHRAVLTFPILVKGLNYGDISSEASDPGNKIEISFTIVTENLQNVDNITVGAGILIGTNTIWTAYANLTIGAAAGTSTAAPTGMVN